MQKNKLVPCLLRSLKFFSLACLFMATLLPCASHSSTDEALETTLEEVLRGRGPELLLQYQIEIHSLSQNLMQGFDQELESVYQVKLKNPKALLDLTGLEKKQVELQAAWQFSENNFQKIQSVYARLLQAASDQKSPINFEANHSLARMQNFLAINWQHKNQDAVSSIAHELEAVNSQAGAQNHYVKTLNLKNYLQLKPEALLKQGPNDSKTSKHLQAEFQNFCTQHWNDYQVDRFSELQNPSALPASVFPDPGAAGTVNGSHFPAGLWALTFDDGPHPTYTQRIIEALAKAHMTGTFFWLSQNLKLYPEIIAIPPTVGFRRGSHSYTHANLPKLSEAGLKHEIDDAGDVFTGLIGAPATFFRCPYGACGPNGSAIRQHIAKRNMIHVSWNVDSLDWQDKNPASIFARVKKQMDVAGHGIVLFHDIHPQSIEAIKLVVAYIQSKPDWKVKTMDAIIYDLTGKEYPSP